MPVLKSKPPNKTKLAKKLGVARSTLYYHSKLTVKDEVIKRQIAEVMDSNPSYGHKRVAMALHLNKKRILRVMQRFKLKPKIIRGKKWVKLGDRNLQVAVYSNEIANLCPLTINIAWSGDFTYINYRGSFVYLATVMDIYNREIVGAAVGRYHNQHLVRAAIFDAKQKRDCWPHYFHSDQGSEYRAESHADYLEKEGVIVSMSHKSSPWENGYQESFYSQFKLELGKVNRFESEAHLFEAIWQQLYYYNHHRIHTALKMSPRQFYQLAAKGR